jgi:hypothetical protein
VQGVVEEVCVETVNSVRKFNFDSVWTQEQAFHNLGWQESIEDIQNLPVPQRAQRQRALQANPYLHYLRISAVHPSPSSHVRPRWLSEPWSKHLEVTGREALKT